MADVIVSPTVGNLLKRLKKVTIVVGIASTKEGRTSRERYAKMEGCLDATDMFTSPSGRIRLLDFANGMVRVEDPTCGLVANVCTNIGASSKSMRRKVGAS